MFYISRDALNINKSRFNIECSDVYNITFGFSILAERRSLKMKLVGASYFSFTASKSIAWGGKVVNWHPRTSQWNGWRRCIYVLSTACIYGYTILQSKWTEIFSICVSLFFFLNLWTGEGFDDDDRPSKLWPYTNHCGSAP